MNKEKFKNYTFENDVLHYKSFISEFTPEVFKEFDSKAEKLGLASKIEDLFFLARILSIHTLAMKFGDSGLLSMFS